MKPFSICQNVHTDCWWLAAGHSDVSWRKRLADWDRKSPLSKTNLCFCPGKNAMQSNCFQTHWRAMELKYVSIQHLNPCAAKAQARLPHSGVWITHLQSNVMQSS